MVRPSIPQCERFLAASGVFLNLEKLPSSSKEHSPGRGKSWTNTVLAGYRVQSSNAGSPMLINGFSVIEILQNCSLSRSILKPKVSICSDRIQTWTAQHPNIKAPIGYLMV
jgi:hypothetical protein